MANREFPRIASCAAIFAVASCVRSRGGATMTGLSVYCVRGSVREVRGNDVTKSALAATSSIAAIPGAFMAYLAVMAFLNHLEGMPTMLTVVIGVTLLFSALMALSPFAILLFSKGSPKAAAEPAGGLAETAAVAAVPARDSKAGAESEQADETGFTPAEDFAAESGGEEDLGDVEAEETIAATSDDAFEFEDDAFEFDDEDSK